jgi:chromosome partitioning protein
MLKISLAALKGGVGKTTVSINLAVSLANRGMKVCILDTDTNRNSVRWWGKRPENLVNIITHSTVDWQVLNKTIDGVDADLIIMDGTPSLGKMNSMIMAASDLIIIPVRSGAHDLESLEDFIERFNAVKEDFPDVKGVFLLNEYNDRATFCKAIKQALINNFPNIPILTSTLKSRISYSEVGALGLGVYEYNDSKAKAEFELLTDEILNILETTTTYA